MAESLRDLALSLEGRAFRGSKEVFDEAWHALISIDGRSDTSACVTLIKCCETCIGQESLAKRIVEGWSKLKQDSQINIAYLGAVDDLDDVSFSRRLVVVRDGKGGRNREVNLMKGTAATVKDYLAVRRTLLHGPDFGALFLNRKGKRLQDYVIGGVLREISKKRPKGLPRLHPHLFRHSIAVHLLHGGADVRHVQMFLGHASLETTKIYLRMVPGRLREDYDAAMPEIAVGIA